MSAPALPAGNVIGILGGGQLGRMLAIAAAPLGYRCHIYEPSPEPPAGDVSHAVTTAAYDDEQALADFASQVDVVTYEFENVPADTVKWLAQERPIRPGLKALETAQDRWREKRFAEDAGARTAPFKKVDGVDDLVDAVGELGTPSILKTRRFGYDGKGQMAIQDNDRESLVNAWQAIGEAPAILEGFVPFQREVSVIAARALNGEVRCFPLSENTHKNHILEVSRAPAPVDPAIAEEAEALAARILPALDYIGVLAIELFVTDDNELLVNEFAPRVHNSGHWTIEGAVTSQFEQHIRAICGLPLGDPGAYGMAEMRNLIGDDVNDAAALLADPTAHLHLYGKRESRPGRKMGHVTRVWPKDPSS